MKIGDSKQVSVYATTEESDVSLEVSEIFTAYVENEEIATLDETGTMTAIKAGQTRLLVNNSSEYAASYPEAITINVEKLDPEYTAPTGLTATYGQTLADVELPEGFIWEDSTTSVGNVGENTFTVTYTPQDTENYKTVTGIEVQVTVGKATYDMSNVIFEDTPYTYDGTEKSIVISGTLPEGVEVRYENNTGIVAGEYSATAIFVGDAVNYNTIENKTAKLIIEKANPTVTAPAGLTATYGQTLSDVELPEGFSWESDRATSVGNVGENTFTVTYTPQDTVNYNTITGMEVKITVMSSLNIDLGEYVVAEENETKYIQGISPETTLGTLKSEITTNGEIQVYNGETPITEEDAKIATGMEIRIVLNGEQVSYKAVVKGDITGDGSADISDLVLLARYVAGTDKNVEVIKIKAMEVNNNDNANKVDMSDLVIMARYVAKTIDKI